MSIFESYVDGVDELTLRLKEIEDRFNKGEKVNKTQYNKIRYLKEEKEEILKDMFGGWCRKPKVPPPPPQGPELRGG